MTQAGALAPAVQDSIASMFPPGERLSSDSTRGLSTQSSRKGGTAASSLVETPVSGRAGQQPTSARGLGGGQTPERTPGSSPRAPSEFQDAGMSLQRASRNDLRTLRCVPGREP